MFEVKLLANLVVARDCYIVFNMFELLIITDYC